MLDNPRTLCPGAAQIHSALQLKLLKFKRSPHGQGNSRPGDGFLTVAAAFIQVGGEPGQDVQAGHLSGGGDGQMTAVSGYWQSLATLASWCRIRSYLDSADSAAAHGIALDAVRAVIEGKPWLPPLPAVS